jgi:hypothetical protein
VANSFVVRLRCPYGDQDGRLVLKDREETLIQVLATPWDFECPVHGVRRALPLEAREERRSSHTHGHVLLSQLKSGSTAINSLPPQWNRDSRTKQQLRSVEVPSNGIERLKGSHASPGPKRVFRTVVSELARG